MQGRILALDYGRKRVGIALTDPLRVIATPQGFLPRKLAQDPSAEALIEKILELCEQEGVSEIVIGEPRRTDGRPNELLQEVHSFGAALAAKTTLPIHYFDEKYTTVIASRTFSRGEKGPAKRNEIDGRAAAILLSDYLRHCAIIGETVREADSKESEARYND
ncbi:MAG: Holliday junction resolvase RuvX [Eubacteriales bacterium]|nr:Holliday junction resolvase RuvX [Eubacteriales bacterium]